VICIGLVCIVLVSQWRFRRCSKGQKSLFDSRTYRAKCAEHVEHLNVAVQSLITNNQLFWTNVLSSWIFRSSSNCGSIINTDTLNTDTYIHVSRLHKLNRQIQLPQRDNKNVRTRLTWGSRDTIKVCVTIIQHRQASWK